MSVTGRRRGGGPDPPVALMAEKDVKRETTVSRFTARHASTVENTSLFPGANWLQPQPSGSKSALLHTSIRNLNFRCFFTPP